MGSERVSEGERTGKRSGVAGTELVGPPLGAGVPDYIVARAEAACHDRLKNERSDHAGIASGKQSENRFCKAAIFP